MASPHEHAALVMLLRAGRRPWRSYVELVEQAGSAIAVLERDRCSAALTSDQPSLFTSSTPTDQPSLFTTSTPDAVAAEIAAWRAAGMQLVTVLDREYPENLRRVRDRPPLIFVAGRLEPGDARSVAVVGTRRASAAGVQLASKIAAHLVDADYTVVSGLAAGIDATAHSSALECGGRTVAVVGTGLTRSYPPQNARLQRRVASQCAVVSQFWPDAPASRRSFPMRNAVISGLTLGTVVVEASDTGGSRIQARLALAQGRPVFLPDALLARPWAIELAARPGAHVVRDPDEITTTIERLSSPRALTAEGPARWRPSVS